MVAPMPYAPNTNSGHGHVWPRPDGVKARCGGPGLCKQCAADQAAMKVSIDNRLHDMARPYKSDPRKLEALNDHASKACALASVMKEVFTDIYDRRIFAIACTMCVADVIASQAKDLDDARLGIETFMVALRGSVEKQFGEPQKAEADA